jgi:TnpA family transposase
MFPAVKLSFDGFELQNHPLLSIRSVQSIEISGLSRQNGLALALRELGKLERTLLTFEWLRAPELRWRSHVGP